jgi:hypothetical protein
MGVLPMQGSSHGQDARVTGKLICYNQKSNNPGKEREHG